MGLNALLASAGAVAGITIGCLAGAAAVICALVFGLRDRKDRRALADGRTLFGEVLSAAGASVHPSREHFSLRRDKGRRTAYAVAFDDERERLVLFFTDIDDHLDPMVREVPYGDVTGCAALLDDDVTVSARGLDGRGEKSMRRKARRQIRSFKDTGDVKSVRVRFETLDPVVPSFVFPLSGPGLRRRGRRLNEAADILVDAHLVMTRYASLSFSERFDPFADL